MSGVGHHVHKIQNEGHFHGPEMFQEWFIGLLLNNSKMPNYTFNIINLAWFD